MREIGMYSEKNNGNGVIWKFFILTLSASILLLLYESKVVFYAALIIGSVISINNLIKLIRSFLWIYWSSTCILNYHDC